MREERMASASRNVGVKALAARVQAHSIVEQGVALDGGGLLVAVSSTKDAVEKVSAMAA
jgi:hypothetical protein